MVWTWITRFGGVVGLIGGSFAIYEFFEPINWGLLYVLSVNLYILSITYLVTSGLYRLRRIETRVDRLVAHFKIDNDESRGHGQHER